MSLAILSRARGVRAALAWVAWDMKASFGGGAVSRQLHSTPGRPSPPTGQIVSSQDLDQRAWASQLGRRRAAAGVRLADHRHVEQLLLPDQTLLEDRRDPGEDQVDRHVDGGDHDGGGHLVAELEVDRL